MRIATVVMFALSLVASASCSGDAEDSAAVSELDAQPASEVAAEPAIPEFTVDTQVVRVPNAPDG